MYIVDIKLQRPSGEVVRVRKVSPVANLRGARAYERELREALLRGDREPPGVAAEVSTSSRFADAGDLADEEVSDNDNYHPVLDSSSRSGHPSPSLTREREADPPPHPRQQRAPRPPAPKIPTFAEFVPDFMRFQASPAASRRGANKPGELREKQRIFDNHLLPAFGALRLDQISARLVDTYVAVKAAPGGGASRTRAKATTTAANRRSNARSKALAPSTIANHLILLRRALSVAHRWELIERVPAIQSPIPAMGGTPATARPSTTSRLAPPAGESRWTWRSTSRIRRSIATCSGSGPTSALPGPRPGKPCAVRQECVDAD